MDVVEVAAANVNVDVCDVQITENTEQSWESKPEMRRRTWEESLMAAKQGRGEE